MKVIYAATLVMAGLDFLVWKGAVMAEFSADVEAVLRMLIEWFGRR